jgi:hypothetical protein
MNWCMAAAFVALWRHAVKQQMEHSWWSELTCTDRWTDKWWRWIAYHVTRQQNCDVESRTNLQQLPMVKSSDQQRLWQLANWRCTYTAGHVAVCKALDQIARRTASGERQLELLAYCDRNNEEKQSSRWEIDMQRATERIILTNNEMIRQWQWILPADLRKMMSTAGQWWGMAGLAKTGSSIHLGD